MAELNYEALIAESMPDDLKDFLNRQSVEPDEDVYKQFIENATNAAISRGKLDTFSHFTRDDIIGLAFSWSDCPIFTIEFWRALDDEFHISRLISKLENFDIELNPRLKLFLESQDSKVLDMIKENIRAGISHKPSFVEISYILAKAKNNPSSFLTSFGDNKLAEDYSFFEAKIRNEENIARLKNRDFIMGEYLSEFIEEVYPEAIDDIINSIDEYFTWTSFFSEAERSPRVFLDRYCGYKRLEVRDEYIQFVSKKKIKGLERVKFNLSEPLDSFLRQRGMRKTFISWLKRYSASYDYDPKIIQKQLDRNVNPFVHTRPPFGEKELHERLYVEYLARYPYFFV